MPNVEFSLPATSVASLGSDFTKVLNLCTAHTLVTASPNKRLSVAIAAGPAWLEISRPAEVTSPGSFALPGILTPSAKYLDGTLSYEEKESRLTMQTADGAVITKSTLPIHSAQHVSAPHEEVGTVEASLLASVLRDLPKTLATHIHFFAGGVFMTRHPEYCCIRSQKLNAMWTLPTALVRLVQSLLRNHSDQEVQILANDYRTGLTVGSATLHWPTIGAASGPPPCEARKWHITGKQAQHLAKTAGADVYGSMRLRELNGQLVAEVRSQEGRIKETLKTPCAVEGFPSLVAPCRQVANSFKLFRDQRVEVGFIDGRLIIQGKREHFDFTYSLGARLNGASSEVTEGIARKS